MGKRAVRVIVVRKWVTLLLLALTTAAMIALVFLLSGKAYVRETRSAADLVRSIRGTASLDVVLARLAPVVANMLLFVPWGFLVFVALDQPARSRAVTYVMTLVAAVIFSAAIELLQSYLPTRVTSLSDSAANLIGALLGATVGHMRKQVRVRFDV